ncbi:MAG: hypothetical protein AAF705_15500, partial [Bacteroidota bacterium]
MKKYIRALEAGDQRIIKQSIKQPKANQGWGLNPSAIIAKQSKQQLKALRLDKSPRNWAFHTKKSRDGKRSIIIILVPTNKTNPKLTTAGSVMTHPYFAKERYATRGVVFEVETTIIADDSLR